MNIIRKTLLRQGKKEDAASYESRIRTDVHSRPDWYFVRMKMKIEKADILRMQKNIGALIQDFMNWWYGVTPHYLNDNSCYEFHRPCDMLQKCTYGDTRDLFQRRSIFSELEDE